jgi:glycosyltransferase involved in cell wall biosynthesis
MNILYFANYFPPSSGAAAICTHKIVDYLSNVGHNVLVLTPGNKGKSFKMENTEFIENDQNLKLISSYSIIKFPLSLFISHFENLARFLINIKSRFDPHLILSQYHTYHYATVVGGLLSKLFKIPHAIRSHDIFIDLKSKSIPFQIIFPFIYPQIYRSIKNCDIDYVQTLEMKEYLQRIKLFKNVKFKVLHNGIDLNMFYPFESKDYFKEKYGCNTVISFIGLISQDTGIYNFIKTLPELFKHNKDTHLILVGDGPYKIHVLNLIKKYKLNDKVHFLGLQPHSTIPFFINNSDIGIGRITHEELWRYFVPVKCLEYMACKKPFITTPISQDVIKNNDVGLILSKDFTEKEIIDNTLLLIEDQKLREKLSSNGLEKIYKDFNWAEILKNFNRDLINLVR